MSFWFLCEGLSDLRDSLLARGSNLDIIVGRPEECIPQYIKSMASGVNGDKGKVTLYCHDEIAHEECSVLDAVRSVGITKEAGKDEILYNTRHEFWGGGTLFSPNDLPFKVMEELEHFTGFRKMVEKSGGYQTWLTRIHPLPALVESRPHQPLILSEVEGSVKSLCFAPSDSNGVLDIFSLWASIRKMGLHESQSYKVGSIGGCSKISHLKTELEQEDKVVEINERIMGEVFNRERSDRSAFPFQGGESAAQRRVDTYIKNGKGKLDIYKETRNGMLGSEYSSKLSPYLAQGCISARSVLNAVLEFEKGSVSDKVDNNKFPNANGSTYWLIFELLWRDYMHFYLLKHQHKVFQLGGCQGQRGREKYPWGKDDELLDSWREGRTGFPIIDSTREN